MACRANAFFRKALSAMLAMLVALAMAPLPGLQSAAWAVEETSGEGLPASEAEAQRAAEELAGDPGELGYIPGEVIVVYEADATDDEKQSAAEVVGGTVAADEAVFDLGTVSKVEIADEVTVETAIEMLEEDPSVRYAIPNRLAVALDDSTAELASAASLSSTSSDMWHLDYVNASQAWDLLAQQEASIQPVKVAVIDSGASLTHPDLKNVVNRQTSIEVVHPENPTSFDQWSSVPLRGDGYTNGGNVIEDYDSHGTHVSGIVAGEGGNGGIDGVASGGATAASNKLVDLTVIDAFSFYGEVNGRMAAGASDADIIFALEYARDQGCAVVNMSLGFPDTDEKQTAFYEELTEELTSQDDMVLVAAAGNDGAEIRSIPAGCGSVIGVISLSERSHVSSDSDTFDAPSWLTGDTTRSSFSSYGEWCDISAPGEWILSSYYQNGTTDGYGWMSGTSMASPVVAAVAAMVRAANPSMSASQVRDVLCQTAHDLHTSGKDKESGYGSVDAEKAVGEALETKAASPKQISSTKVTLSKTSFTYTGAVQKPTVKVQDGSRTLKEGTDYRVAYSNSQPRLVGSYSVTIMGVGQYTGSVSRAFSITVPAASVAYACHVQNIGWQGERKDGALGGTSGRSLRVEAFRVRLVNQPFSGDIQVQAHVQNIGWQNWVAGSSMASKRAMAGTSGRSLRVEALRIQLTGEMKRYYDVYYKTHVQNVGDTGWAKNGEPCGSAGYSYRMEAVCIKLVPKGSPAPGSTSRRYVHPLVTYQTHVQNIGWQKSVSDGAMGGTSGRSLRVEAFRVSLSNQEYSGNIRVRSHVQNIGWQNWVYGGKTSGTSGRSLRVEALRIELTGDMAKHYDVYYRTHCQNVGWTGWAKNGQSCGTAGYSYRMEAVQIRLVPKGGAAPGSTARSFYQR